MGAGGTSTTFASTRATLRQVQRRGERGDKNISFSEDCQYLNTYIDGISVIFREDFNLGKPESVEYRGRGGHCNIGQLSNYCGEINKYGYIISVLFNTEILPQPNIVNSSYQALCFQCQLVRENHLEIVTNLRFHICHLSGDNDDGGVA